MTCEKNTRKGDKPSTDGPVRPGSPVYQMLERIAREIVKNWRDGETGGDRPRPSAEHEPHQPGREAADQAIKEYHRFSEEDKSLAFFAPQITTNNVARSSQRSSARLAAAEGLDGHPSMSTTSGSSVLARFNAASRSAYRRSQMRASSQTRSRRSAGRNSRVRPGNPPSGPP
jgi:hypothetical protein